eukprot:365051-Chlamydomonas_euryale.AAC.7
MHRPHSAVIARALSAQRMGTDWCRAYSLAPHTSVRRSIHPPFYPSISLLVHPLAPSSTH